MKFIAVSVYCITCSRSHTHAHSSVSHKILNQTAKMKSPYRVRSKDRGVSH